MRFDAGSPPSFPRALDGETARFGKGHITDRDTGRGDATAHVRMVRLDQIPSRPLAETAWLESKGRKDLTVSGSGECSKTWGRRAECSR